MGLSGFTQSDGFLIDNTVHFLFYALNTSLALPVSVRGTFYNVHFIFSMLQQVFPSYPQTHHDYSQQWVIMNSKAASEREKMHLVQQGNTDVFI